MKQKLTLLFVSAPTVMGATHPGMVAAVLVIPKSVPAKFVSMSTWLTMKPVYIPPCRPTAMKSRAIVAGRLHWNVVKHSKHIAGPM